MTNRPHIKNNKKNNRFNSNPNSKSTSDYDNNYDSQSRFNNNQYTSHKNKPRSNDNTIDYR